MITHHTNLREKNLCDPSTTNMSRKKLSITYRENLQNESPLFTQITHETTILIQIIQHKFPEVMGDAAEELRKLTKPAPSDEDILGILRDVSIVHDDENDSANLPHDNNVQIMKELDSYDDANYLVKINGVKYLLKIHNGVESQSYINEQSQKANSGGNMMDVSYSSISLQDDMMRHLSKDVYRIKTSCPVSTSKGRVFIHELPVLSREHSPCMLAVRLLKWIEGAPMSSRPCLAIEYVAQAGELLGRVTSALDEMMDELEKDPRSAFMLTEKSSLTRYHAWDVKNTDQIVQKFVHHIEDERIRTLVNDVIESFQKDIIPVQRDFRVGIIHNDYNGKPKCHSY